MIATRAHATSSSRRSLAVLLLLCVLLAAGTLGARALGGPRDAIVRTIVVGHLPDALVLDPDTGQAVVANDGDATVSVLDLASGRLLHTVRVGDPAGDAPFTLALDGVTQRVFVANRGDNGVPSVLRVLDSRSGAPLATRRVGPEASVLAVDERAGHAVVATEGDGRVGLLDARSGALLRTTALGLAPLAVAVDPQTARVFVGGPVTPDGMDVAAWQHGAASGRIGVLDSRSGALVQTVGVAAAPVALAVNRRTARVFAALQDENMVGMLDARSGRLLRTVAVGLMPAALAVDERRGRVFVANAGDGTLSVLDARTGALLQTRPLAHKAGALTTPDAIAVDAARDRVYVTAWGRLDRAGVSTESGLLFVLDARDGAVRRTIAVGVAPRAVAVEAGSGCVVVVDSGGALHVTPGWAQRWLRQVVGWLPWLRRIAPAPADVALLPGMVRVIDAGA